MGGLSFQMEDSKLIIPRIHEYETIVFEVLAVGLKMYKYLQAEVLLEKLLLPWKDYHDKLKHKKKDFNFKELKVI